MKKVLYICISIILIYFIINQNYEQPESFSYDQHYTLYKEGVSGGKTDGFKNNTIKIVNNKYQAIKVAKKELTIEYNQVEVFYDEKSSMWMVAFWNDEAFDQSHPDTFFESV